MSGTTGKRVLIVDDEPDVVEVVEFNLRNAGYIVESADTGKDALDKVKNRTPDLIILDLMLPELDGIEVCKILKRNRATANIPVIMLTARASEVDRVLGLEIGADDYVVKPFSPRELVVRVKKLLERKEKLQDEFEIFQFGELYVNEPEHSVNVENKPVNLTATEFNLLLCLIKRKGRVQTREVLLREVWGYDSLIDTRTVDTHVRRLREKLGKASRFIQTIRNVGYKFLEEGQ